MFWHIAWFEIRFWLKSWMVWIFLFIIATLWMFATSTDRVIVGDAIGNTFRNAPFVIQSFYATIGLFTLLMSAAFVNATAIRDFKYNTNQILFSSPLRRRDFLLGRFAGATLISVIPMLGVSIGMILARYMPWADPERFGPVSWNAHLQGILVFALPNAFFMAAILFAIAVLARNEVVPFVAALALLIAYGFSGTLTQDISNQNVAALLDPFAAQTYGLMTRYWTVAEKNTLSLSWSGLLLWNRLIWLTVACLIFAFAFFRFSFTEKRTKSRQLETNDKTRAISVPLRTPVFDNSRLAQFFGSVRINFLGMIRGPVFIVIAILGFSDAIGSLLLASTEGYGNSTFPVTHWVVTLISGTLYLFVIAIITFYAGALVWQDRDSRTDEIVDSLPAPEWVSYASRLASLLGAVLLLQAFALLSGVVVQTMHGYHRFQLGLYATELLLRGGTLFLFLTVLAFLIHVLSPNKYVGYFVFILFVFVNGFIWSPLNVATLLVRFGSRPTITFSDLFGDAPYRLAWNWYSLYWLLFCGLLGIVTIMFWPRGKQDRWRGRRANAGQRFHGGWITASLLSLVAFASTGGWIWYNTKVLNRVVGPKTLEQRQAEYEKTYKQFEKMPQPRVRSVKYAIDIFPETRNIIMKGDQVIQNPYPQALNEVHFTIDPNYDVDITIPGASLNKDDKRLLYRVYHFDLPLQPDESRTMSFTVKSHNRGFENQVSEIQLVQNGTFFNNTIGPVIGYDPQRQLGDPVTRKKYGLKEIERMPPLERNCTDDCRDTYLGGHSDLVDVHSIVGTSSGQIAIAPGSLVREWQESGRSYFEYQLDHPSMNFYSFMSANYQVAREDWNGIKLEVYYDKQHPWNVPRMMNSIKKSLDYYTKNFSPYMHKEARIIEFPRVARFAQAFPGTMPYSESIGFIANLSHPDDIDMVFYVVAHEMGHQWWAYQVIGANMEGATLLSETMAQYSALMVMEKEYGRDAMRKFLKYEMDNYLRSRGQERLKERPLLTVEANQGYVHYRKGSVVLYYLKEMIGEEAVNRALRKVIQQYAYAAPPYPTSYALVDALREQTPPNLQYLLKDLFEDITIFSNRTLDANAQKRSDGKFDVTINVETQKFKADAKGNETEVPVDDWIDIGAFAKPPKGKKYGSTLYRERVHITQKNSKFTFVTAELPEKAGVDPFALLIDRVPDDNTKKVTLSDVKAASSSAKQQTGAQASR